MYGTPPPNGASPSTPPYDGSKARYAVPSPSPNADGSGGIYGSGGRQSYMDVKSQRRLSGGVQPLSLASGSNGQGYASGYAGTATGYGVPNSPYAGRGSLDLGLGYNAESDDAATPPERVMKSIRHVIMALRKGVEDSARLDSSWSLVWGDPELRLVVMKSSMINLASLLLLSFAEVILSPMLLSTASPTAMTRSHEIGLWYNILFSWPVFIVCFWINASWGPDISRRASIVLHPTYRHQPSPGLTPNRSSLSAPSAESPHHPSHTKPSPYSSNINDPPAILMTAVKSIKRILLIADFHLVGAAISYIPIVGYYISFAYMCIITGWYCFEWNLTSKGLSADQRISYVQERTAYMIGFGFLATFATSFGTALVNMAVFALIYPFFVIQALLARPPLPRKNSLLPSTPSPNASVPGTPSPLDPIGLGSSALHNPFFSPGYSSYSSSGGSKKVNTAPIQYDPSAGRGKWEFRVPLFYMAGFAVRGLDWLVAALLRDRYKALGVRDRDRGKRAY